MGTRVAAALGGCPGGLPKEEGELGVVIVVSIVGVSNVKRRDD